MSLRLGTSINRAPGGSRCFFKANRVPRGSVKCSKTWLDTMAVNLSCREARVVDQPAEDRNAVLLPNMVGECTVDFERP